MINTRSTRKKKRKLRGFRVFLLMVFLVLLGGGAFYAYNLFIHAKQVSQKIYQQLDESKLKNPQAKDVEVTKDPFNVLLVGLDTQGGGRGRSDVLMLLTVNPKTKSLSALSIPRDTRMYLPEVGYKTKINSSYAYGGIESTINAVNRLLDVPINYYITTNFQGFEDTVDTLDGVNVNVPFTFKGQLTESLKWKTFTKGPMYLNGNEALAYVRMRKHDPLGDHGRNIRQQQVIKAIIDKGTSFASITKIDKLMENIGDNVKTNIPPDKFASFVGLYTEIKDTPIDNLKLLGKDAYINHVYYYIPDEDSINQLHATLLQQLGNDAGSTGNTQSGTTNDTQNGNTTDTQNGNTTDSQSSSNN